MLEWCLSRLRRTKWRSRRRWWTWYLAWCSRSCSLSSTLSTGRSICSEWPAEQLRAGAELEFRRGEREGVIAVCPQFPATWNPQAKPELLAKIIINAKKGLKKFLILVTFSTFFKFSTVFKNKKTLRTNKFQWEHLTTYVSNLTWLHLRKLIQFNK